MHRITGLIRQHAVWLLLAAFAATVAPMLIISVYDHPCGDDLYFAARIHDALTKGGAIPAVLQAACVTVAHTYLTWQGTYSAIFLMSLQPAVFNERFYAIAALVVILSLITATFRFAHTLLCVLLKRPRSSAVAFSVAILFCMLQYPPSVVEGFYWFNGAVYYTFYFSLMLVFFDALLHIMLVEDQHPRLRLLTCLLLAAVLGGGNFVTALVTALGVGLLLICCTFKRLSALPRVALAFITLLTGFFISVRAPGNAFRQARHLQMGACLSVICSVFTGGSDLIGWSTLTVISLFLLLLPLIYRAARGCRWRFSRPGTVLLIAFLLFCSQNAPAFYAMRSQGPGRLRDAVYYSYFWLVAFALFYLCGWFERRTAPGTRIASLKNRLVPCWSRSKGVFYTVAASLFILSAVNPVSLSRSAGFLCMRDLLSGRAAVYSREMNDRLALYESPRQPDVDVPALTVRPSELVEDDVSGNPHYLINRQIAMYYHKHTVQAVNSNHHPAILQRHNTNFR